MALAVAESAEATTWHQPTYCSHGRQRMSKRDSVVKLMNKWQSEYELPSVASELSVVTRGLFLVMCVILESNGTNVCTK